MSENSEIIKRIANKVALLVQQNSDLKLKNQQLEAEMIKLQTNLNELKKEYVTYENTSNIAVNKNAANSLDSIQKSIDEIVAEIDKGIALLDN